MAVLSFIQMFRDSRKRLNDDGIYKCQFLWRRIYFCSLHDVYRPIPFINFVYCLQQNNKNYMHFAHLIETNFKWWHMMMTTINIKNQAKFCRLQTKKKEKKCCQSCISICQLNRFDFFFIVIQKRPRFIRNTNEEKIVFIQ